MHHTRTFWTLIACVLATSTLAAGCFVETGDCYVEEYCDVYCTPFECFEDCYYEEYCYEYDDAPRGRASRGECNSNDDCLRSERCADNICVERPTSNPDNPNTPTPTPGEVAFCQECTFDTDCASINALCIEINDGERVCSQPCDAQTPCPEGSECRDISRRDSVPNQCVPIADPDTHLRSCEPPEPEPDCVANADCDNDGICVEGSCQEAPTPQPDPDPEPSTCQAHTDCEDGDLCIDNTCTTPECQSGSDCSGDGTWTCVNAQCAHTCGPEVPCPDDQTCNPLGYCEP